MTELELALEGQMGSLSIEKAIATILQVQRQRGQVYKTWMDIFDSYIKARNLSSEALQRRRDAFESTITTTSIDFSSLSRCIIILQKFIDVVLLEDTVGSSQRVALKAILNILKEVQVAEGERLKAAVNWQVAAGKHMDALRCGYGGDLSENTETEMQNSRSQLARANETLAACERNLYEECYELMLTYPTEDLANLRIGGDP